MARLSFKRLNNFIGDAFGVEMKWFMLLLARDLLGAKIELKGDFDPLTGEKINPVWRNTIMNWRKPK